MSEFDDPPPEYPIAPPKTRVRVERVFEFSRASSLVVLLFGIASWLALAFVLIYYIFVVVPDRRSDIDKQFHDQACLLLRDVNPRGVETYIGDLRKQYPDCPPYTSRPASIVVVPSGTATQTRMATKTVRPPRPSGIPVPGGTQTVTSTITIQIPGTTQTRTVVIERVITQTKTRTVTISPSCIVTIGPIGLCNPHKS